MAGGDTVHATLVAKGQAGVLLRGPPGSGKSDLAFRLLCSSGDWRLVSDDQVELRRTGDRLTGRAPAPIAGKLEVRGVGIIEVETLESCDIQLVVDLVARHDVPRLPDANESVQLLGLNRAFRRLHGLDASSPLKIALLLTGPPGRNLQKI